MYIREWSLIAFSLLAQMAVGSFVILGVAHFWANRKSSLKEADQMTDRVLLSIGPILALGMLASLFHLGNPFSAHLAVTNFATSWLSREILFAVMFAVLGALFALMQLRKIGSPTLRTVVAAITALVGLGLVYSMARIYMLGTQPGWNTQATPLMFFATSFLLGALAMGVAFVANFALLKKSDPDCAEVQCELMYSMVRGTSIFGLIMLGVHLIALPLQFSYHAASGSEAGINSTALMYSQYGILFSLRLVLVFIGAGIFGLFIYRYTINPVSEGLLSRLVYAGFSLVLVSEVIGRYLFYAIQSQIGI